MDDMSGKFGNLQITSLKNLVDNFGLPLIETDVNDNDEWNMGVESKRNIMEGDEFSDCEDPESGKKRRRKGRRKRKRKPKTETKENGDLANSVFGTKYVNLFDFRNNQEDTEEEEAEEVVEVDEKDRTTVVIKNIPRHFTMDCLYQELCDIGFGSAIDYMNMLEDKKGGINRGYAFINFLSNDLALQCIETIQGHEWKRISDGTPEVPKGAANWALVQGVTANNKKHPMVTSGAKTKSWREDSTQACPQCQSLISDPADSSDPSDSSA